MADLFGDEEFDWKKEWQDMPEFIQNDTKPVFSLTVNFLSVEDMNNFSEIIGKRISFTTKSVIFTNQDDKTRGIYVDET
jgi:hypothetical protein|tara:strand:- start:918 stop:1154 length:237 start_codon:yes stop_codon:yes gene_type:complete